MKKKILSSIIALTLVTSVLVAPVSAQTQDAEAQDAATEATLQLPEDTVVDEEATEAVADDTADEKNEAQAEEIAPGLMLLEAEVSPKLARTAQPRAADTFMLPVDLSNYYNVNSLYRNDNTGGGQAGGSGCVTFYYADTFKNSATAGWKTPWAQVTGDVNTLTHEGVDFDMKVVADTTTPVGFIGGTTKTDKWTKVDVPDMKYTSIDLLENHAFTKGTSVYTYAEIRLEYKGESGTEYEYYGYNLLVNYNDSSFATPAKGSLVVKGSVQGSSTIYDANIYHYSIPTDPERVLESVSILGYNYNYNASPASKTQVDGTLYKYTFASDEDSVVLGSQLGNTASVTKGQNIYAITGVTTQTIYNATIIELLEEKIDALIAAPYNTAAIESLEAEIDTALENGVSTSDISNYSDFLDFVRDNQPISKPIDMSEKYNVSGIYSDTVPTGGYGNLFNVGGSNQAWYDYDNFRANAGWKTPWSDVTGDTNIFTHKGVDFNIKVATSGNNAYSVKTDTIVWDDIDVEDMKYTSIDFLSVFGLASDNFRPVEIRLNYADDTYDYREVTPLAMNTASYGSWTPTVGSITIYGGANINSAENMRDLYMHHYSVPVNNAKILESISVSSYTYNYVKTDGVIQYEEDGVTPKLTAKLHTGGTTRQCPIFAMTGMTTVGEYKAWAQAKATGIDTNLSATITEDAGAVTAITNNGLALYKELGNMIANAGLDENNYPNYIKVKNAMPQYTSGTFTAKDGIIKATLTFTKAMADLTDKITVKFNGETVENVAISQEAETATLTLVDRYDDQKNYEIIIDKTASAEIGEAFVLGADATYTFRTTGNMGPVPTPNLTAPVANVATFTATIQNTSGTPKSYYVIIVAYGADGKLVGANFATGTLTDSTPVNISKPVNADGAVSYKALFMDNIENMKTIYETYIQ